MSYDDYLKGLRDGIEMGFKAGYQGGYESGACSGYMAGYREGYRDASLSLPHRAHESYCGFLTTLTVPDPEGPPFLDDAQVVSLFEILNQPELETEVSYPEE